MLFSAVQSMYVKVKRQKMTMFLLVEPTDSVASVKQKLEELVQQVCRPRRDIAAPPDRSAGAIAQLYVAPRPAYLRGPPRHVWQPTPVPQTGVLFF